MISSGAALYLRDVPRGSLSSLKEDREERNENIPSIKDLLEKYQRFDRVWTESWVTLMGNSSHPPPPLNTVWAPYKQPLMQILWISTHPLCLDTRLTRPAFLPSSTPTTLPWIISLWSQNHSIFIWLFLLWENEDKIQGLLFYPSCPFFLKFLLIFLLSWTFPPPPPPFVQILPLHLPRFPPALPPHHRHHCSLTLSSLALLHFIFFLLLRPSFPREDIMFQKGWLSEEFQGAWAISIVICFVCTMHVKSINVDVFFFLKNIAKTLHWYDKVWFSAKNVTLNSY